MRKRLPWPVVIIMALASSSLVGSSHRAHAADDGLRVSCSEPDWTFTPGQQVARTLRIVNNTNSTEPFDLEWSFQIDGKAYAEGAETFALQSGITEEYAVMFRVPALAMRTEGKLVIACLRDGQEVFRDVKPCVILSEEPTPRNGATPTAIASAPFCLPRSHGPAFLRALRIRALMRPR